MSQTSVLRPMIITRRRLKNPGQGQKHQSYQEIRHVGDCRGSIDPMQGHPGLTPSPCPHHPPTHVFIYRNAHYVGFFHRLTQYLLTYNRVYVLQPLNTHFRQARVYLLEFLGFLILLFLAPFLVFAVTALYVTTKLKILLVSRRIPEAIISEKLFSRSILKNPSQEMVNSIVWTNGKVNLEELRSKFFASKIPILKRRLGIKYGLQIWESDPYFNITEQIFEAPRKHQGCSLNDLHGFQGQKSTLQKYITHCMSIPIDLTLRAPWEIILIPQPSTKSKARTCCLLRFHGTLLKDPEVRRLLDDIFSEQVNTNLNETQAQNLGERYEQFLKTQNLDEPLRIVGEFGQTIFQNCETWYKTNIWKSRKDIEAWSTLRWKQWQFHPKKTLLKAICIEALNKTQKFYKTLKHLNETQLFQDSKTILEVLVLILRALSFIPIQVLSCFLQRSWSGFQKIEKVGSQQVAWSDSVPDSLLEAICERTGVRSVKSLLLAVTSMALREYYLENGIPNPKRLNVCVPVPSSNLDFLNSTGFKVLPVPTDTFQPREQIKKLSRNLDQYPLWQLLGTSMAVKYLPYFMPRSLSGLVLERLVQAHPITFTYLNPDSSPLSSIIPTMSLWGHPVEEFTAWKSSHSDSSVSITVVKYVDSMRLTVVSPMKSVDLILAKRFSNYLNRLAEAIGVDKSRIPYSRKPSPTTTSCTSPSTLLAHESKLVNLVMQMQY